jgi:hypothetical protein
MARKRNEARSISGEGAAAPATHRRSVRASVTPSSVSAPVSASSEPQPAAVPETTVVETPTAVISSQDEIAKLAFSYWEARGCQGGSPEEDWARAEQEVHSRRKVSA